MPQNPDLQHEWEDRALRQLDIIRKYIDLSAPDTLVAQAISRLHILAVAYLGQAALQDFTSRLISHAKSSCGICQTCQNKLLSDKSSKIQLCEQCQAKETAREFEAELEMGAELTIEQCDTCDELIQEKNIWSCTLCNNPICSKCLSQEEKDTHICNKCGDL